MGKTDSSLRAFPPKKGSFDGMRADNIFIANKTIAKIAMKGLVTIRLQYDRFPRPPQQLPL